MAPYWTVQTQNTSVPARVLVGSWHMEAQRGDPTWTLDPGLGSSLAGPLRAQADMHPRLQLSATRFLRMPQLLPFRGCTQTPRRSRQVWEGGGPGSCGHHLCVLSEGTRGEVGMRDPQPELTLSGSEGGASGRGAGAQTEHTGRGGLWEGVEDMPRGCSQYQVGERGGAAWILSSRISGA